MLLGFGESRGSAAHRRAAGSIAAASPTPEPARRELRPSPPWLRAGQELGASWKVVFALFLLNLTGCEGVRHPALHAAALAPGGRRLQEIAGAVIRVKNR